MATHKDALKRMRQNVKRQARNQHFRSMMRNSIKRVNSALEAGDLTRAEESLPNTVSAIQRVARKGIIHRKQAARRVSRLTKAVNRLRSAQ